MVGVMINKTGRTGEHPERRHLDYIKQVSSPFVQKISLIKERLGSITTFSAANAITTLF